MDIQTVNDLAAAIRIADGSHSKGAGELAEALATALDAAGYALVKLPRSSVDEDGLTTWPVEQSDDLGKVRLRRTDGRIDHTSVFTPFKSTGDARAFAAALLAAADHVDANPA